MSVILPRDVVDYVFGYLDVVDLVRSTRVCVLWRERGTRHVHAKSSGLLQEHLGGEGRGLAGRVRWGHVSDTKQSRLSVAEWKLSMVGPVDCGTTCLSHAMASGKAQARKPQFIGPTLQVVNIQHPSGNLKMWEKHGGKSRSIQSAFLRKSNIHLLCYDTSKKAGFRTLLRVLIKLRDYLCAPCVLVGTKCDLPPDPLTTDLANILSYLLRIPHVKTSAATMEGIPRLKEIISKQCIRVSELRVSGKLVPRGLKRAKRCFGDDEENRQNCCLQ